MTITNLWDMLPEDIKIYIYHINHRYNKIVLSQLLYKLKYEIPAEITYMYKYAKYDKRSRERDKDPKTFRRNNTVFGRKRMYLLYRQMNREYEFEKRLEYDNSLTVHT